MVEHGIWKRAGRRRAATALLIAGALALTDDAASEPITEQAEGGGTVAVSTGLVTLRPGKAIRLSVVEVDGSRPPRTVRMSVIDGERRILRETVDGLTPRKPLFLDLARREIPPPGSDADPLPIRAEWRFECDGPGDSGPVTTLEVYDPGSSRTEVVNICGCPCCMPSTNTAGPIQADCGGGQRVDWLSGSP